MVKLWVGKNVVGAFSLQLNILDCYLVLKLPSSDYFASSHIRKTVPDALLVKYFTGRVRTNLPL